MRPQVNASDTCKTAVGIAAAPLQTLGHPLSLKKQRWPYVLWEEAPGGLTVRPEGHWILSGHLSFLKARGAGQPTFPGNCDWTEQGHLW